MRRPTYTSALILFVCLCLIAEQQASAQGFDTPLTMQGLNQKVLQSARSRAQGGITLGMSGDVGMMFANPALLQSVDKIAVSFGGASLSTKGYQDQHYGGVQSHSALNLLLEGVTGWISDPDTIIGTPTTSDTVQRPFDQIGPDWNHSKKKTIPMQVFVAVPFVVEDIPFVVGAGMVQWANLDRYYANNNCFSPSVLSVLNGTISTLNLNTTPYITQWYQYIQERSGSINGYGAALSVKPVENLSVGVSALILSGKTDDFEIRVGRGMMTFYNNSLRLSKNGMTGYQKAGTSDFKGMELIAGATYSGKNFTFGFSVKPPTTITRTYSMSGTMDSVTAVSRLNYRVDSLHAVTSVSASGEDKMKLPWRGTVGVSINLSEKLSVGLEYEIRAFASALYTNAAGVESNPWLSGSLWHVGAEFRPYEWMSIRGGVREDAEVYEPLSNAIRGDPPKYSVYSLGLGFAFMGAKLNIGYEYGDMKYVDTWSNSASITREFRSAYVADISYAIPW